MGRSGGVRMGRDILLETGEEEWDEELEDRQEGDSDWTVRKD